MYPTVATPSIFKMIDDAGVVYTFALLEKAQTLTTTQTVAPTATNVDGVVVNMPASTANNALTAKYNGATAARIVVQSASRVMLLENFDNGSSIGPYFSLGYNNNGSTPAAGHIAISERDGSYDAIWPDNTGVLRIINNAQPTNATDVSGTIVGSQSSWHELKENIVKHLSTDDLLQAVLNTQLYDYQMRANGNKHTGIVITEDDRKNNAWYGENMADGQIPALNERNLFGYLVGAIQEQQTMIEELRQEILAVAELVEASAKKGGSAWQR